MWSDGYTKAFSVFRFAIRVVIRSERNVVHVCFVPHGDVGSNYTLSIFTPVNAHYRSIRRLTGEGNLHTRAWIALKESSAGTTWFERGGNSRIF